VKHLRFHLFVIYIGALGSLSAVEIKDGRIDIELAAGGPDYVKVDQGKRISTGLGVADKLHGMRNLKSFAIAYKAWQSVGEFCYSTSFVWELDPDHLVGRNPYGVNFAQIAKYPDLATRYRAIAPTSVSFTINATLWRLKDAVSRNAFFKVTNNDLVYFGSRSPVNYTVPSSPFKWNQAFSLDKGSTRFTDRDSTTEDELRDWLKDAYRIEGRVIAERSLDLTITWPDDAIDEIAALYKKYEKEGADRKHEDAALLDPTKAPPIKPFGGGGIAALPYEDEGKDVEAFEDKKTGTLELKTPRKTIATFDSRRFSNLRRLEGTKSFVVLERDVGMRIMNARGKIQSVGGYDHFTAINRIDKDSIVIEIATAPFESIVTLSGFGYPEYLGGFYSTSGELRRKLTDIAAGRERAKREAAQRRRDEWNRLSEAQKEARRNDNSVIISMPSSEYEYGSVGRRRLTVDNRFEVKKTEDGYAAAVKGMN